MLALAVGMKLGCAVNRTLALGADAVLQIFARVGAYPLLLMVGVALMPWMSPLSALRPANLLTIAAKVFKLVGIGFVAARTLCIRSRRQSSTPRMPDRVGPAEWLSRRPQSVWN